MYYHNFPDWDFIKSVFLTNFWGLFINLFRDNGITIQILTYQLYVELFLFLTGYIRSQFFIPVDFLYKLTGIISTFAMFVILPLFYLNGDANFRNRVLQQGLWKALKKELFQTNTEIHSIR